MKMRIMVLMVMMVMMKTHPNNRNTFRVSIGRRGARPRLIFIFFPLTQLTMSQGKGSGS